MERNTIFGFPCSLGITEKSITIQTGDTWDKNKREVLYASSEIFTEICSKIFFDQMKNNTRIYCSFSVDGRVITAVKRINEKPRK